MDVIRHSASSMLLDTLLSKLLWYSCLRLSPINYAPPFSTPHLHVPSHHYRFSRLCRERGPDLGVRACVRTLSPPNPGIYHGNSQRASLSILAKLCYKYL